MRRLKQVAQLIAGGTPDVSDPGMWADSRDGGMPFVTIADMSFGGTVTTTIRGLSSAGVAAKGLTVGAPGMTLFAMYASVGEVATLGIPAVWNQALLGVQPRPEHADSKFVSYWLRHLSNDLGAIVRTTTQDNLNAEQVANFPFPDLGVEQQRRIADFLDDQVSRLGKAVILRDEQAEILASRRSAAFTSCVDESAPHRRLGHLLELSAVGVVVNPSSYFASEGVPFVHGYNVRDGYLDLGDVKYMSSADSRSLSRSRLREGDVLVVRAGYPGRAAVVPRQLEGGNCASVLLMRPGRKVLPEYLCAFFNSALGKSQVEQAQYGAAQGVINLSDVVGFEVPLPSVEDQSRAVEALQRQLHQTERLRDGVARSRALLQERKRALITAAVTGEFDVATASGRGVA